ncbi:MAG: hypothetical protein Q8K30_03535 [Candidatus Gracilibacteria bacterium]|nr:hypothetical protein [Candidatus Gracilibacteria bacterium]MDP2395406.1 hypothetical protein [bacterium]
MNKNTYHTLEEARKISDERILKNAKAFSEKIISKQKENQYV